MYNVTRSQSGTRKRKTITLIINQFRYVAVSHKPQSASFPDVRRLDFYDSIFLLSHYCVIHPLYPSIYTSEKLKGVRVKETLPHQYKHGNRWTDLLYGRFNET